ncbi:NmrA family transcriptional regulator [Solirubrobacter sp. CPCC 204708]|uniref:NmrA family transcriptional regulator n=1 Tax=Solirubrobacter deserti TaxID=2282478 RepID=A0ABT4RHZ9_9ACTN|nr:NmrA family transcriptional regulator [Solirubrobacter deserti]MBE2318781.1 NmrA family transcriptional regulator [Solirubrobacter deserti]MDA0138161.1 NmrA family transcriptional regulator [Solirubrobacter deserti]
MKTLITSSTGKTGRRILDRLAAQGVDVRGVSRSTGFDWESPSTWASALEGIEVAYIAYYPDLAVDGAADTVHAFARQAAAAGVRRLVLLSGRGEPEAQRAEELVASVGTEWTVVRCSWFAQNFSESMFLDGILAGRVELPADAIPEPFVDVEDIVEVATLALTQDGHHGEIYELTGPRALTMEQAVAEIARAAGKPISYARVSPEQYRESAPPEYADIVLFLMTELLDGRNAEPQDGVQRALGRPPRDFAEYAERTAATGVWG